MTGEPHLAISVGGNSAVNIVGTPTPISDAYVPSGSQSLHVNDGSGFRVGDRVEIIRPVTPEWLHLMGMDALQRNGKKETWVSGDLKTERTIASIAGDKLSFDVPLTDSYDLKYLERGRRFGRQGRGQWPNRKRWSRRLPSGGAARKVSLSDKPFNGLQMNGTVDGWIRDLRIVDDRLRPLVLAVTLAVSLWREWMLRKAFRL